MRPTVASAFRSTVKTVVRKAVRARGYDIVPTSTGLPDVQRRLLARCDGVIDVGANTGQFAERVRDFDFGGPIVSFEPGAAAFTVLQRKATRDDRWSVHKAAVGAASGESVLRVSANSVSSSLLDVTDLHVHGDPKSATVDHERVQLVTLDEALASVNARSLYMKLDVQGFELPALAGAPATLQRTTAVQVEVSFDSLYDGQTAWLDLCRFLQERDFVVLYVEPGYEDAERGVMLQADLIFGRRALVVREDAKHPVPGESRS